MRRSAENRKEGGGGNWKRKRPQASQRLGLGLRGIVNQNQQSKIRKAKSETQKVGYLPRLLLGESETPHASNAGRFN